MTTEERDLEREKELEESLEWAKNEENKIIDYYALGGFMDYHDAQAINKEESLAIVCNHLYQSFNVSIDIELSEKHPGLFERISQAYYYLYNILVYTDKIELEVYFSQSNLNYGQIEYLRKKLVLLKAIQTNHKEKENINTSTDNDNLYIVEENTPIYIIDEKLLRKIHDLFNGKYWKDMNQYNFIRCFDLNNRCIEKPSFGENKQKPTKQDFCCVLLELEKAIIIKDTVPLFNKSVVKERFGVHCFETYKSRWNQGTKSLKEGTNIEKLKSIVKNFNNSVSTK